MMVSSQISRRRAWAINGLGLLVLVTLSLAVTSTYVSRSRWFFHWDTAFYHDGCIDQIQWYERSFELGLRRLHGSTASDYSYVYCQPLVPFMKAFGESRMAYEIGLCLFYQVPFYLVMGAIALRLTGDSPDLRGEARGNGTVSLSRVVIFWGSVFIVFLMPRPWVVTLLGYPDIGALALFTFALWLYLGDRQLGNWRRIVVLGLCLGMLPLFRRHYAYDAAAFFVVAGLMALVGPAMKLRRSPAAACREALVNGLRLGLVGAVSAGFLLTLGHNFVSRVMATNSLTLYASYAQSSWDMALYYINDMGTLTFVVAIAGFCVALATFKAGRPAIAVLGCLAVLTALIWTMLVPYRSPHYPLHFVPMVGSGLVLAFWSAWEALRSWRRALLVALAGTLLATNFYGCLGDCSWFGEETCIRSLLAARDPPPTSPDYDEVVRLIEFLCKTAHTDDAIFVTGSSARMNDDLVRCAERQLYGLRQTKLDVLSAPHVDSRDYYPLEALLSADYVVQTEPFQGHLAPEEQRVASVACEVFAGRWELSDDFELLPEPFRLQSGVAVKIYRRRHPTSVVTALRTLDKMMGDVGRRPGNQPEWVMLTSPTWQRVRMLATEGICTSIGYRDRQPVAPVLACVDRAGQGDVEGRLAFEDPRCLGARVILSAMTLDGQLMALSEMELRPAGSPHHFRLPCAAPADARLLLTLATIDESDEAFDHGAVRVDGLRVVSSRSK